MGWDAIGLGAAFGLAGGLAALCIRLITPGSTFLTPPEIQQPFFKYLMTILTYTSDWILGAIAGVAAVGLGGIAADDIGKLSAVALAAGVGGSGFLANLGNQLQAEQKNQKLLANIDQHQAHAQNLESKGNELKNEVDSLIQAGANNVGADNLNKLSDQVNQLLGASETPPARPTTPPTS